jgi:cellulose synthase/poly-beta-1,6-N-acetylglucosamine synthase-like glycosyltransferase
MIGEIRRLKRRANDRAVPLLLLGLAGVTLQTWRLARRDRAALARAASPAPAPAWETWPARPSVSVLVAAWNEAAAIDDHLRSFCALRYPHKQLVLCAGGDDGTFERACRWANLQVVVLEQQEGEGKQQALRRCLPYATGAVIVLTDADCLLSEPAFCRLLAPLATGASRVVTGTSEPYAAQRGCALVQYQWLTDLAWSAQLPETVDGVLGRNCALLRPVLDEIGGFDAPVRTGTDYFMSRQLARAGHAIRAVPDSRIATRYPDSARAYLRMWRRWNKNLLIHGPRFGAWRDVRGVASAYLVYSAGLILALLAPLLGPAAAVPPLLVLGLASSSRARRVVAGARLAGGTLPWGLLARVPFYTCLDMLAVLLAGHDAVRPGRRARW